MPALSNPVLSCSLFSPDTFPRYHFSGKVTWGIPRRLDQTSYVFTHQRAHKEGTQVARDGKSKRTGKTPTIGVFIWFHCAFWWSSHANVVLQMTIPAALRYNVPRGAGEFAFAGLGGMRADWVAVAAGATNTRAVCWSSDRARCDSQRRLCRKLKTHTPCKGKHGGMVCKYTDAYLQSSVLLFPTCKYSNPTPDIIDDIK